MAISSIPQHAVANGAQQRDRDGRQPARRPHRTLTALLLLAGLVGALTVSARAFPPSSPAADEALTPRAAWLGAWVQPASFSRQVQQDAVLELERQIGRRLAVDHTYVPGGTGLGWRPAWDVSLGRIPLITFASGAFIAFLVFCLYKWLQDDVYAVNDGGSLIFMGCLYLLAVAIYVGSRIYRRRQGMDLKMVYGEIPAE